MEVQQLEPRVRTLEGQMSRLISLSDEAHTARLSTNEMLIRLENRVEELFRLLEGITTDGFHRCVEKEHRIRDLEKSVEKLSGSCYLEKLTKVENIVATLAADVKKLEETVAPIQKRYIQIGAIIGAAGFLLGLLMPLVGRLLTSHPTP